MKIVNRTTFLALPAGTVFAKYDPHYFGELCIKGDTIGNDFSVQDITDAIDCESGEDYANKLDDAEEGTEVHFDFECEGRDGMFDDGQLFAVWSQRDTLQLVGRLIDAVMQVTP